MFDNDKDITEINHKKKNADFLIYIYSNFDSVSDLS